MAFASATHDIAADGFYMLALPEHHQSAFVGVRNTFYRLAMIAGQGAIVVLAGSIEQWSGGDITLAWSFAFAVLALLFRCFLSTTGSSFRPRRRGAGVDRTPRDPE